MSGSPAGLRIGLVCPYSLDRPGGVQNHVLGLAGHLRAAGHLPVVIAPGATDGRPDVVSAGGAVPVPYNGSVARVSFGPRSAGRVRRWLADGAFDLVHLHEPVTPSIALAGLLSSRTPVVATFHTATPHSRTMSLAREVLRRPLRRIDAGIAVSEAARDVVVQHLGRDAVVIPNGFDYAAFAAPADPRPAAWRSGPHPRLVFLGRVDEPRKGLDVLLAAGPKILAEHPDLEVVVAGQGRRTLPGWCRPVGALSETEKVQLLREADVFVAPHRERESFGIVLLEAMASRTPVVASDLAPFAALLGRDDPSGGGTLGRVFPAGDERALAQAVIDELAEQDRGRLDAAQAHARHYDWATVGRAVLGVYGDVLAGRPVRTPDTRASRARSSWPPAAN